MRNALESKCVFCYNDNPIVVIKVTNPNTKVKSEVVVEGLSNFLE